MSPRQPSNSRSQSVDAALRSFWTLFGVRIDEARVARGWTTQRLADEAGVSRGLVYLARRGEPVSFEAALRMVGALGLKLNFELLDPRRRPSPIGRQADIVHSAMGELEAGHMRRLGHPASLDEPYQFYQFAGRADLVAWDVEARALLHIENRTRFPDLQETAGAYNAKRAYLGRVLADRLGVRTWASETHLIAALWSAEVLHVLRLRTESFRALCPDPPTAFEQWWSGRLPAPGNRSLLVVLDPLASGRQRQFISLDAALVARPRFRGYADAALRLT